QLEYISNLSYRVEGVGNDTLFQMPIGIILYNDSYEIEWINPYMKNFTEEENVIGKSLDIISKNIIPKIKSEETEENVDNNKHEHKKVIEYIYLDNYEEITRNMTDNVKSRLNSKVTETLNKWAEDYGFYIKRTSQDRFIGILTRSVLDNVEESKFEVLDEVRQLVVEEGQRNP